MPEDWNVVVVGRWNPALFTPARISRRVFGLDEKTPVEVFLPLDEVLPPRVRHDAITVSASATKLVIGVEQCRFQDLVRAIAVARKAVDTLPETPLSAVGVNVRYRGDAMPSGVARSFSEQIDKRFSDHGFKIVGRQFVRKLALESGHVRVFVTADDEEKPEITLNFELKSTSTTAVTAWLDFAAGHVMGCTKEIIEKSLGIGGTDYEFESDNSK